MKKKTKSKEEFDSIWNEIVSPLINNYSKKYSLVKRSPLITRAIAKIIYKKQRNVFIKSYMAITVNKIDRHKIAACLMKALLIVKPLRVRFKDKATAVLKREKIDLTKVLINQYLSLSVACSILTSYIYADPIKELKHNIYLPEPFPEDDPSYLNDVCLDLFYTNPRKFNIIAYSNIFFLLEKYSCRFTQCKNLEEELKKMLGSENADEEIKKIKFRSEERSDNT